MSLVGRVFTSHDPSTANPADTSKPALAKLTAKVNGAPLRDAVLLGPYNLAPAKSVTVPHGLGRQAKGFVVAPASFAPDGSGGGGVGWASVINQTSALSKDIQATHISAYNNSGVSNAICYLLVF